MYRYVYLPLQGLGIAPELRVEPAEALTAGFDMGDVFRGESSERKFTLTNVCPFPLSFSMLFGGVPDPNLQMKPAFYARPSEGTLVQVGRGGPRSMRGHPRLPLYRWGGGGLLHNNVPLLRLPGPSNETKLAVELHTKSAVELHTFPSPLACLLSRRDCQGHKVFQPTFPPSVHLLPTFFPPSFHSYVRARAPRWRLSSSPAISGRTSQT